MLLPSTAVSHENRLRALTHVAAALNASLRLDEVLQRVLDAATTLTGQPAPFGCIARYDATADTWRVIAWNLPPKQAAHLPRPLTSLPAHDGMLGLLLETADVVEIADTYTDPRLSDAYVSFLPPSLTAIPLVQHDQVVGGIVVAGLPATEADRELLLALGKLAAVAIQNAELYEQAQQAARESARLAARAAALRAIGTAQVEERDLTKVLTKVVEAARRLIDVERSQISLLDEGGRTYTINVVSGPNTAQYRGMRIPVKANTLVGHALRTREMVVSNDPAHDPRAYQPRVVSARTRNVAVAPLKARGKLVGTINVSNKLGSGFTDDDVALLKEFAQMAALAVDNARQFAEADRTAAEQRAMRKLMETISQESALALRDGESVTAPRLLRLVVDHVRELAHADGVGIVTPDSAGDLHWLLVAGQFGAAEGAPVAPDSLGARAVQQNRPVYTKSEAWTLPEALGDAPLQPEGLRAAVAAPLSVAGAAALGAIYIGWCEDRAVRGGTVLLAERAAAVAATALLNDDVVRQARDLGRMQERARIARDLHDSVTQSLFTIHTLAQLAPTTLETRPDEARDDLDQIRVISRDALAEMRTLLDHLRPLGLRQHGLPDALRRLAESNSHRPGPEVRLRVRGTARPEAPVEDAFFRIAQEALSNARRHSGGSTVEMTLELSDERVVLVVRDNGSGFDAAAVGDGSSHMGMTSMRERAAEIGGKLKITASPGNGTTVRVSAPRCLPTPKARP